MQEQCQSVSWFGADAEFAWVWFYLHKKHVGAGAGVAVVWQAVATGCVRTKSDAGSRRALC